MSVIKTASGYCCRRKVLTNRLLLALVQILVIVGMWQIFTPKNSENENKDLSKKEMSIDSHTEHVDSHVVGLSQSAPLSLLQLNSLLSKSPGVDGDGNLTKKLAVDLYVRNPAKKSVLFYPAGTLIDLDVKTDVGGKKDNVGYEDTNVDKEKLTEAYTDYDDIPGHSRNQFNEDVSDYFNANAKRMQETKAGAVAQVGDSSNQQFALYDFESKNPQDDGQLQTLIHQTDRSVSESPELRPGEKPITNIMAPAYDNMRGYQSLQNHSPHGSHDSQFQQPFQKSSFLNTNNINAPTDSLVNIRNQKQNFYSPQQFVNIAQRKSVHGMEINNFYNPAGNEIGRAGYPSDDLIPQTLNDVPLQHGPVSEIQFTDVKVSSDTNFNREFPLADGFLERANKFNSELHGKTTLEHSSWVDSSSSLLMNNGQACLPFDNIDILYLINSKPQSSDMRQRIRETFVQQSYFQPSVVVHVFLLGRTTSSNFQNSLNQEQEQYSDIVQGDFMDSLENATRKGIMGFSWVAEFCHGANFIMIINEDVFVDTDKLLNGLIPSAKKVGSQKLMLCYFNAESPIPRTGPNAFGENLFPGRSNLRPYCKGFAVLMTRGVVLSLLAASRHVPPVHMDELYLYGILPFVAGGIDVFDVGNKRAFHNFGMETMVCYQQKQDRCPFVASVAFSERFTALWNSVKARMQMGHPGWEGDRSLWNIQSFYRKF